MNYDKLFDDDFKYKISALREAEDLKKYFKKKMGWIYIVKTDDNVYLKIGRTAKHPMERAKSLSSTGVLSSYEVLFSLPVFNQFIVESKIHKKLKKYRISKEFFSVDINTAIKTIEEECHKEKIMLERFIDTEVIKNDINLIEYAIIN
ncbi:GIY-YIG nuclease family protein [Shigella flexneri]